MNWPDFMYHPGEAVGAAFAAITEGPMWDKLIVPMIVGAVSAVGSSYATTIKLEERIVYIAKRLENIENDAKAAANDRLRLVVVERDVLRAQEDLRRMEERQRK